MLRVLIQLVYYQYINYKIAAGITLFYKWLLKTWQFLLYFC